MLQKLIQNDMSTPLTINQRQLPIPRQRGPIKLTETLYAFFFKQIIIYETTELRHSN